jgi:hypothetical protein
VDQECKAQHLGAITPMNLERVLPTLKETLAA